MSNIMVLFIKFYQNIISKYIIPSKNCRFYPTCSSYSIQAYEKYGFFKGSFLTIKRILRCNPFNNDDYYDPLI